MTEPTTEMYAAQLAVDLPDWSRDYNLSRTPGAVDLGHPDGHRLGFRIQPLGGTIQAWITAGPLPAVPTTATPDEAAKAQTALDARIQPGHTWHAVISPERVKDPYKALLALAAKHLIPALTRKPRHAATAPEWLDRQPLPRKQLTRTPKRTTAKKDAK